MSSYYEGPWYVYILEDCSGRRTYVGATKTPDKRLDQHNGIRKGGAKRTRSGRPWTRPILIGPFPDSHTALVLEWAIKHNRCGSGLDGRVKALRKLFSRERWTS